MLIVAAMWWPLSARLAMSFVRHGASVATASHPKHPLRHVEGISRRYAYHGLDSLGALKGAIEREQPELVVPCDDGVVWQLHLLHERCPELREVIERSLGGVKSYAIVRSRAALLGLAAELGIATPDALAMSEVPQASAARPAVLKVDGTCGGNGVEIVRSADEARRALARLSAPASAATAWKQMVIDRNPLAMFLRRERHEPRVTAQRYVAGRPANAMLACREGELLAMVAVESVTTHGATGAATVVRVIDNGEISHAARLLAKRLGLSGFCGLDFVLEEGSGKAVLIELNPRATQLGHLHLAGRGDLVGALLGGKRLPAEEAIGSETIAFFPQAVSLNARSAYLTSGFHDVPADQPGLYRELLRGAWPDRRPAARLYHFLRPRRRYDEVCFDPSEVGQGEITRTRLEAEPGLPRTDRLARTG